MFIDLEKSPAQIDIKEMHYVNNFFGKLFKHYFLNFERNSSRELKHDLERLLSDN